MKKITAFILSVCLCFCFTSCGEEETVSKPSSSVASGPSVFDFGATQNQNSKENDASDAGSAADKKDSSSSSSSNSQAGSGYSSADESDDKVVEKDPIPANAPRIICWGDSITEGMGMSDGSTYPSVLQKLLGTKYRVLNGGASGEKSWTIAARQGAYKVTLDRDLVFNPDYGSVYLDGKNGPNLIVDDGSILDISEWGGAFNNDIPCKKVYISGKEYTLAISDKTLEIVREEYNKKLVIKKGTEVVLDSAKKQQGSYCEIFYIGANDGIQEPEKLVARYKAMAKRQGSNRYIVIIPQWDTRYTEALKEEFGDKALDIREKMCAIDAEKEFGYYLSSDDKARMRQGKFPLLYMYENKEGETLHFSKEGYNVMAHVIYEHGKTLGYW